MSEVPTYVCTILFCVGMMSAFFWLFPQVIPGPQPTEPVPEPDTIRRVQFIVDVSIQIGNPHVAVSARRGDVWLRNPDGTWARHGVTDQQVVELVTNRRAAIHYGAEDPPTLAPPLQVQFVRDYESPLRDPYTGDRSTVARGLVFTLHDGWWINGSTSYYCTDDMMGALLRAGTVRRRMVRVIRIIEGPGGPIRLGARFEQRPDGYWLQERTFTEVCTAESMADYLRDGIVIYEDLSEPEPLLDVSTEYEQTERQVQVAGLTLNMTRTRLYREGEYREGEFRRYMADRRFTLANTGTAVEQGMVVEYDGTTMRLAGQSPLEIPQLRGAIRAGWLSSVSDDAASKPPEPAEPAEPVVPEPKSALDRLLEEERDL